MGAHKAYQNAAASSRRITEFDPSSSSRSAGQTPKLRSLEGVGGLADASCVRPRHLDGDRAAVVDHLHFERSEDIQLSARFSAW